MKKVKLAFWLLIVAFIGLLYYQNQALFMQKHQMELSLPFMERIHTPDMFNGLFFLCFFLVGLLIAAFFAWIERMRSRKAMKGLLAESASLKEEIQSLQRQLTDLRGDSAQAPAVAPAQTASPNASEETVVNDVANQEEKKSA